MSTSDDYYIAMWNNAVAYLYRYGNLLLYILGTMGNLLSIFIFLKRKWRKNVCVFYFLVYLLLSLVYLNSTIVASSFMIGWNINVQDSSVILCKLLYYVPFVVTTLTPTFV